HSLPHRSPRHRRLRSFPTRRSSDLIELAAPIAGVSKVHQRICTHHVQRLQLSRPSRFHHLRRSESRLRRKHRAPKLFESFAGLRSEEHTSELQSHLNLVCRLLLEKK